MISKIIDSIYRPIQEENIQWEHIVNKQKFYFRLNGMIKWKNDLMMRNFLCNILCIKQY